MRDLLMCASGQKRKSRSAKEVSGLPSEADVTTEMTESA
jgi:hypothetical protein